MVARTASWVLGGLDQKVEARMGMADRLAADKVASREVCVATAALGSVAEGAAVPRRRARSPRPRAVARSQSASR